MFYMGILYLGDYMKGKFRKKQEQSHLEEQIKRLEAEVALLKRIDMKKEYLIQSFERQLQLNKTKDLLTDTYNKQHLSRKYRESVIMRKRWGFNFCICLFDLDSMTEVNQTYGTDFGDSLLKGFSKLTKLLIRDELDSLFRIGGDEFVIILIDCEKEDAMNICRRIQREFYNTTEGHSLTYGVVQVEDIQNKSLDDYLKFVKMIQKQNKMIN